MRQFLPRLSKAIPLSLILWFCYSTIRYPNEVATSIAVGVGSGAIYALIALGFGLIYNTMTLINFAHGEIFMLGGVISTFLLVEVMHATNPNVQNFVLLIFVIIFTALITASLSWLTYRLVFRKLESGNKLAPLIASIGLALVLQNLAIKINGSGPKKFMTVLPEALPYRSFHPSVIRSIVVLLIAAPILLATVAIINRTKQGMALRAISEDRNASALMGINAQKTIAATFLLAGFCAGVGGVVYSQHFQLSNYTIGMEVGLLASAAAIIGGIGSIRGTIFGGFLIGIIEALSNGVTSGLGFRWSQTAIYSVFILMLVYRPQGILGNRDSSQSI